MSRRLWNPWHVLRHDIGRKFTALALALLVWGYLETQLVGERDFTLEVIVVSTPREADQDRAKIPGVYLVVPDELIVIAKEPSVRLKVKGLKDDIENLILSAVLTYDTASLGDADEAIVSTPIDRDTFKSPGKSPQLTEFRIRPNSVLDVTLARRETLEDVTLGAGNVDFAGKPRDGYVFKYDGIRVAPNTVTITGPRGVLRTLATDPGLLQLAPVNVEGKTGTVTKRVGLSEALIAQGVTLLPAPGTVAVTIPVEPEDMSKELYSVEVYYDNADTLAASGLRVVNTTTTLDLKLVGPRSELSNLTPQQLGRLFQLRFDWADVPDNVPQGRPKVSVHRTGLSYAVQVLLLDSGDDPFIEYSLEPEP